MEECCHYLKDVLGKLVDDPRLAGQGPAVSGARALGRGEPGSQGQAKNRQNNFHFSLFDFRVKRTLDGVFLSSFILRYP